MRHFLAHWPRALARLRAAPHRLFLFDYDGVLTPIAPTPAQAWLKPSIRNLLRRLSEQKGSQVGILSGRSLAEVRRRIRLPRLIYAGNHGLEIAGHRFRYRFPVKRRSTRLLRDLTRALTRSLDSIPGALVEPKAMTLSLHYRLIPAPDKREFHRRWRALVIPLVRRGALTLRYGKAVVDIGPRVRWDKGEALKYLQRQMPRGSVTFYAGDDVTDEDAFRALRAKDWGVRVGRSARSAARYAVRSPREMETLLKKLVSLL